MQQVANGVNAGVKEFQSRGMLYAIEQDLDLHIVWPGGDAELGAGQVIICS